MIKRSLLLFLYSTPNIIGCIWGVIGLVAFFTGIIKAYWFFIVIGLYACGYVLTPKSPVLPTFLPSSHELSVRDLQIRLEELIKKISHHLTQAELNKLNAIKENIVLLLPHLEEMNVGAYDLHIVKQTVLDYLPKMLTTYVELPPAFARMHKMRNGKTAQEVLFEQLSLLDVQINQIVISVNSQDAEALIAQGEFLKNKFSEDAEWI